MFDCKQYLNKNVQYSRCLMMICKVNKLEYKYIFENMSKCWLSVVIPLINNIYEVCKRGSRKEINFKNFPQILYILSIHITCGTNGKKLNISNIFCFDVILLTLLVVYLISLPQYVSHYNNIMYCADR
jgi:hypothetical protein